MGALRLSLGVLDGVAGDGDVGIAAAVVERGGVLGVDGDRMLNFFLDWGVVGWRCFTGATLGLLTMVLLVELLPV